MFITEAEALPHEEESVTPTEPLLGGSTRLPRLKSLFTDALDAVLNFIGLRKGQATVA